MIDQIDYGLGEPNMASARRKNNAGICAMHQCQNKLNDPPATGFLGVKICDECHKPLAEWKAKVQQSIDRDMFVGIMQFAEAAK